MESPMTYAKRANFATTDGQQFEWNLAALLFLRGLNSGLDFQMATNLEGAGAMDDVVFRYKPKTEADTWTTLYVQLKYKANRPVQRALLTSPKGDFSLKKYFESSLEIKNAMTEAMKGTFLDGNFERSVFVIFTNAKTNQTLGERCCATFCQAEEFVWCGLGQVFNFKDDEEMLRSLGGCGEEGNEFLGRLQLFCGQPCGPGLEAVIESELKKVDGKIIEGVDFKSLFGCFLRRMKVWWEKSNEVLHRGNDLLRLSVLEVTSQQTKNGYILDLVFEEEVLAELRDSFKGGYKIFTVKSSEISCWLSLTKLSQAFGGQSLVLDCKGLLANKEALLVQWGKKEVKSLIICTNGWEFSHQVDYLSVVKELLAIPNTQPVVFLIDDAKDVVRVLTGEFQDSFNSFEDKFLFSQLKEESREKVFATEVSIQGHSTTLRELILGTPESADRVLDARSVLEIFLTEGILTLGQAFDKGIDYYVDRQLEIATVVKSSVLQDSAFQETVTVQVMQYERPVSLRNSEDNTRNSYEHSLVSDSNRQPGLFETVIHFLSSSIDIVNEKGFVTNLHQSQLAADQNECDIFIGSEFLLGMYTFNSVVLRLGSENAVTALRVQTPSQACFLFVSDKTNENDVKKLSEFHQSKHWVSLKDGQLHWIESQGDIESIRPHIDGDQVLTFSPEKVTDVEDRLVLVCAEPGMGKSTLMARLAKNTKEAHPDYFVFLIALNDHSVLFAQDIHNDVLGFLCSANKIESHLHRSLLKYALEVSGYVVVLFDGYDEIAPKYIEQSWDLLSKLIKETKARMIWMTSRNSVKLTLEGKVNIFSAKIREFNKVDQETFLRKFLKGKSQLLEEDLDKFINKLIEKTSQAVRDKEKSFMGIPLQTQILAEVYEDHVTGSAKKTALPEKLDVLMLLEQFVDKKYNIYYRDKLKILSSNTNDAEFFKMSKKGFVESHANAALILILGDGDIIKLRKKSIIKKCSKFFKEIRSGSYKTGFIDSIVNDKPRFLHRIFAEYFVAKWISKKFADYQELVESKMFTAEFSVIRNFFDRLLAKNHGLHTAVVNEDPEEVRSLLEREDVNEKDGGGRTALHLAAGLGTSEDQEQNRRRCEILDLLIGKTSDINQVDDVLEGSPLKYADLSATWVAVDRFLPSSENKQQFMQTLKYLSDPGLVDTVFYLDLHNLLGFSLDNGFKDEFCSEGKSQLLLRACELGSLKVATLLIKRNPITNEVSGQRNLFLHKASENGKIDIVKLLLKHQSSTLCPARGNNITVSQNPQLTAYINLANHSGKTAIHLAAQNNHIDVISFLTKHGGNPLRPDSSNSSPLHLAAKNNHPNALRVLLEALDETNRADVVNSCDNYGNSVLLKGTLGGCLDCVSLLIKFGGKLTLANSHGNTPLMTAAAEGYLEMVNYFLKCYSEEREGVSLLEYINMEDNFGWNATLQASLGGHSDIIGILIIQGSDLHFRSPDKRSYLHYASGPGNPGTVRFLLEALDEDERAAAVNLADNKGYTALMSAAIGGCVDSVQILVEAGGEVTQVSEVGHTPLMLAAMRGRQEVLNYLLSICSVRREGISKQDYINMTDVIGKSAIHYAALRGCYNVIFSLMAENDNLQDSNRHYRRSLLETAWFKDPGIVRTLLEAVCEDDRTVLANSCDIYGNSVLMCAALGGCVETVDLLVKAGAIMTQANNFGQTPLMFAALQGRETVLSYFLKNLDSVRDGLDRKDFINMADKDGKTVIHYATRNGALEAIRLLFDQGSDLHRSDYYKITSLHLSARIGLSDTLSFLLETLDEADRPDAVNARDKIDGNSVLMCGILGGYMDCIKLLVQAGGKLAQTNDNQRSPLMEAAFINNQTVLEYILNVFDPVKEGIAKRDYITMKDKDGKTALDLASTECRDILQTFLV